MTAKTTLSLTGRHHRYLLEKVAQGMFRTRSAAVAAAIEQMMQEEAERNVALSALAEEIRMRMRTPRSEFLDQDHVFSAARATIGIDPKT